MRFCESLPKVNKFSSQLDNEVYYNLTILSSYMYYTVNEVQNLKTKNNLHISF